MAIDPQTGQEIVEPNGGLLVSTGNDSITPESLVSNQLTSILNQGSPLQDLAASRSKEQANQLGLLSSSLAVGAGQKAVIDSALPIAQQDAGTFAQSGLSKQVADQNVNLTEIQSGLLSKQSTQDAAEATALQNVADTARSNLSAQGSTQDQTLSAQGATQDLTLAEKQAKINTAQSAQDFLEATDLQITADTAANSRTAAQIASNIATNTANIAADDRADYGSITGQISQQYISAFQGIQTTSDDILSQAQKNLRLAELKEQTIADLNMQASIFGFTQEWDVPDGASVAEVTTANNITAPTQVSTIQGSPQQGDIRVVNGSEQYYNTTFGWQNNTTD